MYGIAAPAAVPFFVVAALVAAILKIFKNKKGQPISRPKKNNNWKELNRIILPINLAHIACFHEVKMHTESSA